MTIQQYNFDRNEEFCRLFETVFGKPMGRTESMNHFNWEYLANPAGKAVVFVAKDNENRIVSAYPAMPLRMKLMSAQTAGSLSFDSMTHPLFKGQGLFTKLGRELYRYLENNHCVLTYGFPNGNIQALRINRLRWFELCDFPLLVKVMDFRPIITRLLPGVFPAKRIGSVLNKTVMPFLSRSGTQVGNPGIEDVSHIDAEFDVFWEKVRSSFPVCVERDSAYLQWRYGKPEEKYKIIKLKKLNTMAGYAVLKIENRFNFKTGYIMDFVTSVNDDAIHGLLSAVIDHFQKEKVDLISALLMKEAPYYTVFRKSGFLSVPRRFHPQEIHFSARIHIDSGYDREIRDSRNWFISWGDTDLL